MTLSPDIAGRIEEPVYADAAKMPWIVEVPEGSLDVQELEIK